MTFYVCSAGDHFIESETELTECLVRPNGRPCPGTLVKTTPQALARKQAKSEPKVATKKPVKAAQATKSLKQEPVKNTPQGDPGWYRRVYPGEPGWDDVLSRRAELPPPMGDAE